MPSGNIRDIKHKVSGHREVDLLTSTQTIGNDSNVQKLIKIPSQFGQKQGQEM
jgi:hypothetical protein